MGTPARPSQTSIPVFGRGRAAGCGADSLAVVGAETGAEGAADAAVEIPLPLATDETEIGASGVGATSTTGPPFAGMPFPLGSPDRSALSGAGTGGAGVG